MSQLAFEFEPSPERKAASAVAARAQPLTPEDMARLLAQHPEYCVLRRLVPTLDHCPAPASHPAGVQRVLVRDTKPPACSTPAISSSNWPCCCCRWHCVRSRTSDNPNWFVWPVMPIVDKSLAVSHTHAHQAADVKRLLSLTSRNGCTVSATLPLLFRNASGRPRNSQWETFGRQVEME